MSAELPTPAPSEDPRASRLRVSRLASNSADEPAGRGPVIDWEDALARMEGDADLLREICAIFLKDAPAIRARLQHAASAGGLEELQGVAHNLKGAAATLSAREVTALAAEVEHSARAGRPGEARALAVAAILAFDRLLAELQPTRQRERPAA